MKQNEVRKANVKQSLKDWNINTKKKFMVLYEFAWLSHGRVESYLIPELKFF